MNNLTPGDCVGDVSTAYTIKTDTSAALKYKFSERTNEIILQAAFIASANDERDRDQITSILFEIIRAVSRATGVSSVFDLERKDPEIDVDGVIVNTETVRKYRGRINTLEAECQRLEEVVATQDLITQQKNARIENLERIVRTLGETAKKSPAMTLDYFLEKRFPAAMALLNLGNVVEQYNRAGEAPVAAAYSHNANLYLAKEHLGTLLDVLMLARSDAPDAARLVGSIDPDLPDKIRRLIDRINTEWRETPAV